MPDLDEKIERKLVEGCEDYRRLWNAKHPGCPTRHVVIDDLLPAADAEAIANTFPPHGEGFDRRETFREHKSTSYNFDRFSPLLREIVFALQADRVVAAVSRITGIASLEPDPSSYAGGLSMMFKGDFLNPHIDNSHESKREKYRRLNLLYYCSPGRNDSDGANLELWDERVRKRIEIPSRFNRLVIMETNRFSWHSVNPCLTDSPRNCVSGYFFTGKSPEAVEYYHVTSFMGRPGQKFVRAFSKLDNLARQSARRFGASRNTDKGYSSPSQDGK